MYVSDYSLTYILIFIIEVKFYIVNKMPGIFYKLFIYFS